MGEAAKGILKTSVIGTKYRILSQALVDERMKLSMQMRRRDCLLHVPRRFRTRRLNQRFLSKDNGMMGIGCLAESLEVHVSNYFWTMPLFMTNSFLNIENEVQPKKRNL
jgi:hypothetical protein